MTFNFPENVHKTVAFHKNIPLLVWSSLSHSRNDDELLYSLILSTLKSTMSTPQAPGYPMLQSDGLTVIELFQSQGCSSCPPANSNVLKLAEDPNLLILTYDVTYWDRLGWIDTFGNSANDRRQWDYARALSRKNVSRHKSAPFSDMQG